MITVEQRWPAPRWALLQRLVIAQLDRAAAEFVARYARADGTLVWRDDWAGMDGSDDPYEAFQNLPLLYVLGGSEQALTLAERMWEGITWQWSEYGQIHDEFDGYYDWMHHGESSLFLYFLGLAKPGSVRWKRRAAKFADLYAGPGAVGVNYDPVRRLIRSPLTGSRGPRFVVTEEDWRTHRPILQHSPFEDIPGVGPDTPYPWLDDATFAQILERMNERMTRGDVPLNLSATGLVTHGYLFTGDQVYRRWVLEYVDGWLERTRANGGVVPDNIGLDGQIGEHNDGKWWGGYYGWRWPRGLKDILESVVDGGVNAVLLGQDLRFLTLPRLQIDACWELRRRGGNGEWLLPLKHRDDGWCDYQVPPPVPLVHLWCTSMAEEDAARIDRLELPGEWWRVTIPSTSGHDEKLGRGTKHLIANTMTWYRYIRDGKSEYPEAILEANLETIARQLAKLRSPAGDPHRWDLDLPDSIHMWQEMCPLIVEGLAQLTLGAPMHLSHGGLQHARVRYYDAHRRRPGLPPDVAALVSELSGDAATVELVNLSPIDDREVVVQGGGFGEHDLVAAELYGYDGRHLGTVPQPGRWLHLRLAPGAGTRLELRMRRYANPPTYDTPWSLTADIPTIRRREMRR